jgi:DnaK suppressor protein
MASTLSPAQLDALRRRLEDERARILRVLATPGPAPADDARAEFEEAAQRETERAHAQGVASRERALLAEVDRALARMREGTYGTSEATGEPIPYERLAAVPWARRGVDD